MLAAVAVLAGFAIALAVGNSSPDSSTRVKGERVTKPPASDGGARSTPSTTRGASSATTTTSPVVASTTTSTTATSAPRSNATGRTSTTTTTPPTTTSPAGPPATELVPPVSATRALPWSPGILAGTGNVWVADVREPGRLARVDANGVVLTTGAVARYVSGLAATSDGAWVLRSSCPSGPATLVHVGASGTADTTFTLPDAIACDLDVGRSSLALAGNTLWIASPDPTQPGRGFAAAVDPSTGQVVTRVALAGVPQDVQAQGGRAWVTLVGVPGTGSQDAVVQAVDGSGARVVITYAFGFPLVRDDGVWSGGATGLRQYALTGALARTLPVDGAGCGRGALFGFVPSAVTPSTIWGTRLDVGPSGPGGATTLPSVCRIARSTGAVTGWDPGTLQLLAGDDAGAWLVDTGLGGFVRWTA